jgi:sugar transferase (PEP-CTERM/EpsH1 system associated)
VRILYLCHRIPYPPDKGDKIRAFHQLRALSERHEVDLFTLVDDPSDLQGRQALEQLCRKVVIGRVRPLAARVRSLPYLATSVPLTVPYFRNAQLMGALAQASPAAHYDRVFVYCSAMAQYAEAVGAVPVIVDFVDVDSDKWRQYGESSRPPMSWIYRREARALRAYERTVCRNAGAIVVTTRREADLVRSIDPAAAVHVIANGVDSEYFSPGAAAPSRTDRAIVFTGDMAYYPNEQAVAMFAHQALPIIRRRFPDARFFIVGRRPSPTVRELGRLPGVEVTGFVSDVRTYLARASVAVAPFQIAAGIQNKILEAMSYGLPVVATSRAVQGLEPNVLPAVQIGDTPAELASHCIHLLADHGAAERIGTDGRKIVRATYSWQKSLTELMTIVECPDRCRQPAAV